MFTAAVFCRFVRLLLLFFNLVCKLASGIPMIGSQGLIKENEHILQPAQRKLKLNSGHKNFHLIISSKIMKDINLLSVLQVPLLTIWPCKMIADITTMLYNTYSRLLRHLCWGWDLIVQTCIKIYKGQIQTKHHVHGDGVISLCYSKFQNRGKIQELVYAGRKEGVNLYSP